MMEKITAITPLNTPKFLKPMLLHYTQNNQEKTWEAVESHDSVAILLYHKELESFLFVKQLRAPVLHANPNNGYMYELCAGIIDKPYSKKQIAQEEILEECGYDVSLNAIEEITSFYTSVGISGTHQTLYYAEVTHDMKKNEGGGIEDEIIEVISIPLHEAKKFMFDISYQKTAGILLALYWWFENKHPPHT